MQRLHVHWRVRRSGLLGSKHVGRPVEELGLPLGDLVGMHIELLGQFGQGLLALHSGQGHFGLESRRVIAARSLAHRFSCSAAILAAVRQKLHLSRCPNFPSRLCLHRSKSLLRFSLLSYSFSDQDLSLRMQAWLSG